MKQRNKRNLTVSRRRNYARGRALLEKEAGGCCVGCGCQRGLEFHHIYGRDWVASRTSRWVRLARYRREWLMGLVELRCRKCNAKLGRPGSRLPIAA